MENTTNSKIIAEKFNVSKQRSENAKQVCRERKESASRTEENP